MDSFSMVPSGYSHRINKILTLLTEDQAGLEKALSLLHDLIHETDNLVNNKNLLN